MLKRVFQRDSEVMLENYKKVIGLAMCNENSLGNPEVNSGDQKESWLQLDR